MNSDNAIDVDNLDDIPLHNCKFNKFANSVLVPDFDMQVDALMHQISAETLMFQNTSIDVLADRIAVISAILARAEIKRLITMSTLAHKNLASSLMNKNASTVKVTPDSGIVLTALMSELSVLADRTI